MFAHPQMQQPRYALRHAVTAACALTVLVATSSAVAEEVVIRLGTHRAEVQPWQQYYLMSTGGKTIGYGFISIQPADDKVQSRLEMRFRRADKDGPGRHLQGIEQTFEETPSGLPVRRRVRLTFWDQPAQVSELTVSATGNVEEYEIVDGKRRNVEPSMRPSSRPASKARPKKTVKPEKTVMIYGEYLMMRKHGLREGTEYGFGRLGGGSAGPLVVTARVGRAEFVDIGGTKKRLVPIRQIQEDLAGLVPKMVQAVYVDREFRPLLSKTVVGRGPESVWTACSEKEAKAVVRPAKP